MMSCYFTAKARRKVEVLCVLRRKGWRNLRFCLVFFWGYAAYLDTFSATLRTLGKRITGEKLCCLRESFESLRLNFFSTAQKLGLAITNELNAKARRKSKCAGCFKAQRLEEPAVLE